MSILGLILYDQVPYKEEISYLGVIREKKSQHRVGFLRRSYAILSSCHQRRREL